MITVIIDDRRIETPAGRTVLEVAREQGIPIPTVCYHEALAPFGACRLCVVEVEAGRGRQLVASCSYPCADGLSIYTRSEAVLRSRRTTVELLLATARHVPAIRRLAVELGVDEPRFTLLEDSCILCGLCVRACREIVGVGAISVINRGIEKMVSPPFRAASNDCIGCGTCVLVCPTGASTLADIASGASTSHVWPSEYASMECRVCGDGFVARRFVDPQAILASTEAAEEEAAS